jgi:hypothetical protein
VKDIVDAGGILEIDTKDDQTSYCSLVGIINRRGMAPDSQQVIMVRGKSYRQHALGERLVADANEWDLTGRLRSYLAEMSTRIELIADDEKRADAAEWLTWCEEYVAKRDPFAKPIRQPKVRPPGYSDIQEFRKRLGFGSGW